jgi:hypothetical protein
LAHTLEHLDRISTDLEDHIPLNPGWVQTWAHLHHRCTDLEDHPSEDVDRIGIDLEDNTSLHPPWHNTSRDADSNGTISAFSQYHYSDQPNNGTAFLVPSPAEDSDPTGAISRL